MGRKGQGPDEGKGFRALTSNKRASSSQDAENYPLSGSLSHHTSCSTATEDLQTSGIPAIQISGKQTRALNEVNGIQNFCYILRASRRVLNASRS